MLRGQNNTVKSLMENSTAAPASVDFISTIYWLSMAETKSDSIIGAKFERQWMRFGNHSVADRIPENMLHLVAPQLYQFPPMETIWYEVLIGALMVISFFGWIGNGIVIYIFVSTPALRTPSNLLIINLAKSDFIITCMMTVPMIINCWYETWVLGPLMCELYAMVGSICGNVSIWTMVVISRDRYNAIVKGIAGKPLTTTMAIFKILLIWLHAGFWTSLPMFGWNRYIPEGNLTSCGLDFLDTTWPSKSYIIVYSIFVYFIPLLTIIYSYWFIVAAVAAHERSMREQAKKMGVTSLRSCTQDDKSAEIKLAKIAMVTIALWFTAWSPYFLINYTGIFELANLSPFSTIWGSVFAKASACYNPVVYAISHPKFRIALKKKIPWLVFGSVEQPVKSTTDGQSTVSEVPT